MKLTNSMNYPHIFPDIEIFQAKKVANTNTTTSIKALNSKPIGHHSTDISYLKSFDTAVLAYHMIGLANF
ncbi:hypothetical protein BV372_28540 [Nostoc sp. T09]|uniref:hypothetical protein n=1 Tax=Nostoc sp. T09 TaxID=1932621 RepID=UPI000A3C1BD6|nr:hypothetical protein [Nostoc sp. T09]OUL24851.1 hypothetical protein BV372_28540 [Nostoc sp. T09]